MYKRQEGCFGISTADISTGQCLVTEMDKPRRLVDEITKFMPAEIICNQSFLLCGIDVEDLDVYKRQEKDRFLTTQSAAMYR